MMYPLAQRNKQSSQETQQKVGVQTVAGSIQQERVQLQQNQVIKIQQGLQKTNKGHQDQNQENCRQSDQQLDIEEQGIEQIPRRKRPLVRRVITYFRQAWTGVKSALGTLLFSKKKIYLHLMSLFLEYSSLRMKIRILQPYSENICV